MPENTGNQPPKTEENRLKQWSDGLLPCKKAAQKASGVTEAQVSAAYAERQIDPYPKSCRDKDEICRPVSFAPQWL